MTLFKLNLQFFSEETPPTNDQSGDPPPASNEPPAADKPPQLSPELEELITKKLKSETDKVRTEWSKRLKAVETENEQLRTEKMTEKEKAEYELQKQRDELDKERRELSRLRLENKAIDLLKDNELPLEFKAFVVGSDEDSTAVRVDTLKKTFAEAVQKAVEAKMKDSGRDFGRGEGGAVKNPWSTEHFNLTEQARILMQDPGLAERLKNSAQ